MPDSSNLALPLLASNQAQKHVTVNEALRKLDALVQLSVLSQGLNAPPTGVEGERYIAGSAPTGAWTGGAYNVFVYANGAWVRLPPRTGWTAYNISTGMLLYWSGSAWLQLNAVTDLAAQVTAANGARTGIAVFEQQLTLTASGQGTTGSGRFPSRSIMLGASVRVTLAITGTCTSFEVGITGETNKFGGTLPKALNTTNVGVIGPTAVYALTPVLITGVGGTITGGRVRVAIHYLTCGVSSS